MAKKNLKIDTTEFSFSGTLNSEMIEEGVVLVETEDGEIPVHEVLSQFDGDIIEMTIKRKIEKLLV